MTEFYERQIINGAGEPMRVVWEYNGELRHCIKDCGADVAQQVFDKVIIPKFEQAEYAIWEDRILRIFGYIWLNYNFELVCYICLGDPLETFCSWGRSFPSFVDYRLSKWAGKDIVYWQNYPPRKPFRFTCRSYRSGNNIYYLQADTEKALSRDFNRYPVTEDEKRIWKSIMKCGSMQRATDEQKAEFLAGYFTRIGKTIEYERQKLFNTRITL